MLNSTKLIRFELLQFNKIEMIKLKSASLILLLVGLVSGLHAQETQKTEEQKTMSAQQVLSAHYAGVYQMAIRYNDYGMAKNALYNLYVENPQNDSILYSLSALYLQSGQFASAAISAQDVLSMRPKHTAAMEIMAVAYENLGLKDKALDGYESLYLQTDDYQTLYKIAFLQYELGRLQESKTNIDILLGKKEAEDLDVVFDVGNQQQKEFPIKVALLNLKGLIAKDEGDKASAKKFFNEALTISPDFPFAKENLQNIDK